MKKIIKLVIVLGLILTFACACMGKQDSITGNWKSEYVYNNNNFVQYYTFYEDGSYVNVSLKNGKCNEVEKGHYENEMFKVTLYSNDRDGYMEFDKSGNNLINADHVHKKYIGQIPEC